MISILLALASVPTIAYGALAGNDLALFAGFFALLFSIGLHELPIWREIHTAEPPPAPEGDLLDFSDIDWSAWDREHAA